MQQTAEYKEVRPYVKSVMAFILFLRWGPVSTLSNPKADSKEYYFDMAEGWLKKMEGE